MRRRKHLPDGRMLLAQRPMLDRRHLPAMHEPRRDVPRDWDELCFALPTTDRGVLPQQRGLPHIDAGGLRRRAKLLLGWGIHIVRDRVRGTVLRQL